MKNYMVTFRSITLAQRAERLLNRGEIDCALQRTPRWMEEQGCGYSIRINNCDLQRSIMLLRQNRIDYKRIYRQTDSDGMEVVGE